MDIKTERIDAMYTQISASNLIYLPEGAISVFEFLDRNVQHRKEVVKYIELKSLSAEKATVELINKYVEAIQVSEFNRKGLLQFQLPPDKITPENWRVEEHKPIDKYDWLSFEKVFRPVAVMPEAERSFHCK